MQRIRPLSIPDTLPHPDAIRSWGSNQHDYEPDFWEFQYEFHRYLGRVPGQELVDRYTTLLRNMKALISADRHVIPIQSPLSSWYWYRKEHQTRLEFHMRGVKLPLEPPAGTLDRDFSEAPIRPRSPNAGDVLIRYGNRTYMEEMVRRGRVRVGPASYYQSLELGGARKDDEREKSSFMPGQYTNVTTLDGKSIPVIGDVRRTVSATNYYTLCLSCDWDSSLFDAFDADACVVIRAPEVFGQRLDATARSQFDGWYFHHSPIQYFDPYEMSKNEYFDASMCKDFRFAYQREYRFLWAPFKGQKVNGFKYLDLGSLDDVAELHIRLG